MSELKKQVKAAREMKFEGYPLRCVPHHQDDCERWDYEIQIDNDWIAVISEGLKWNQEEALKTLVLILKSKLNDNAKRV